VVGGDGGVGGSWEKNIWSGGPLCKQLCESRKERGSKLLFYPSPLVGEGLA
jgi:hypothetical protein